MNPIIDPHESTRRIRQWAAEEGFSRVGIARADYMEPEAQRLRAWLDKGYQGTMSYLERNEDLRTDPRKLVPGARSVVVLAYNYYRPEPLADREGLKIARYAAGKDYHRVLRKRLKRILARMRDELAVDQGRVFIDSAPILERDWARRAGLGWVGKNTLLIHPKMGSYFFLSEIISDAELVPDEAIGDYCGSCRACIDACPTGAISQDGYQMDGSACISYLTIESKAERIDNKYHSDLEGWIYGCDICQEVCPWNRFSQDHQEEKFTPSEALLAYADKSYADLGPEEYDELFRGSAVRRAGYDGWQRNIQAASD